MKYHTFEKKYGGKTLQDDGAYVSKDFKTFAKSFRALLKENAEAYGWSIDNFDVGHYDMSAFLVKDGKYLYVAYSPTRMMPLNLENASALGGVLMRTAQHNRDYTGGRNHFCSVKEMPRLLQSFDPTRNMR